MTYFLGKYSFKKSNETYLGVRVTRNYHLRALNCVISSAQLRYLQELNCHPREGGDPVFPTEFLDPRLRGDDIAEGVVTNLLRRDNYHFLSQIGLYNHLCR